MSLFRKKPLAILMAEAEEDRSLRRTLGPVQLVGLGIGAIIGAGLFSLTGIAAANYAGPAVTLGFVLAAVGCAFAAFCYSEFATMIPIAGSAYTYSYATMGELIAWIIGWDLVLEYAVGAATVSVSWSAYVVSMLHDFGIHFPPELAASPFEGFRMADGTLVKSYMNLPAVLIVVAISTLLMVGIKESARVNALIVVIKVSVVLVFIAVGWNYINPQNHTPFIPENTGQFGHYGWSGILRAAGVVFFAFIGFDAVSTAAQEARNPRRDMPIGIIGSLAVCTLLYVLFSWTMTGMVDYRELNVAAPVAVAIDKTPYQWLKPLIKLAIISGFTSVILVMLLGQSRVFYSMSRDGLLWPIFSRIHPTWRTPYLSNVLFMVFVSTFAAFFPISKLGEMTSIGTLFAFVLVCAGVLVMRKTAPHAPRPFRTPWVPVVPVLGILVNFYLMYGLPHDTWIRLLAWLALGLVIYAFYGRKHSKAASRAL